MSPDPNTDMWSPSGIVQLIAGILPREFEGSGSILSFFYQSCGVLIASSAQHCGVDWNNLQNRHPKRDQRPAKNAHAL